MSQNKIKMRAKYEGTCLSCEASFKAGSWIYYNPELKKVWHYRCINNAENRAKSGKKPKKKGNSLVALRPARGGVRHFRF
jgi:hypothetical protein